MRQSTTATDAAAEREYCRPALSCSANGISRRSLLAGAAAAAFFCVSHSAHARPAVRHLSLLNPETGDCFDGVYWRDGAYVDDALQHIDWLMRDFHQDKVAAMDRQLLNLLHRLTLRLGTRQPIHILSGYRTPATDRLLRREGFAPAANSLHLDAKAADICIRGVSYHHLYRAALSLRMGGVGSYPHEHFVHVDVGPRRTWTSLARPRHRELVERG